MSWTPKGRIVFLTALLFAATAAHSQDKPPLRIGVIAEFQAIAGASIPGAAQIAADEINAKGGVDGRKIELVIYDDHSASTEAVRAFQRLVSQDKVNVVLASYASEVVLALQPWASRLKTPLITPGASSDVISANIHADYERNRYSFHGFITSTAVARLVCAAVGPLLIEPYEIHNAVVVVEDAAWTKPLAAEYLRCLGKSGLAVSDKIVFAPDTTDFTPIFNKIEAAKADLIVTGISHAGVQPTVQWKAEQVPIPMFGVSSQATNATFWHETNGAAQGVMFFSNSSPVVATTPKTIPFAQTYKKRFGAFPSYAGYPAYDAVYYVADAVKRSGSLGADQLVDALEDDRLGRDARAIVEGLISQWQDGKQVVVFPSKLSTGKPTFPSFVRLRARQSAK